MDKSCLGADIFGQIGEEGDDVMAGFALNFVDDALRKSLDDRRLSHARPRALALHVAAERFNYACVPPPPPQPQRARVQRARRALVKNISIELN